MEERNKKELDDRILITASTWTLREGKGTDLAWLQLKQRIDAGPDIKSNDKSSVTGWLKIAASIAIVAGVLSTLYFLAGSKVETFNSQRQHVVLPDGSEVILHANSSLNLNRLTWYISRKVEMSGEAWFDVQKGESFRVSTPSGTVEVLGTSFDVLATEKELRVFCKTGKVRVAHQSLIVEIGPEEMAYANEEKQLSTALPEVPMDFWKNGKYEFEETPLPLILSSMEREFNVAVKCSLNPDRKYTGSFSNSSLEEALELICAPLGATWEISNVNGAKIVTIE